jgi:hypothetical protein
MRIWRAYRLRMGRIHLYLPDDLRDRMDTAAKASDVNWSSVAATAFELHLAEIAARKKRTTMKDTVQRLRASRLKTEKRQTNDANKAGMKWTAEEAEWAQLQSLEALFGTWKPAEWNSWNPKNPVSYKDPARGGLPFFGPGPAGPIYEHVLRAICEVLPVQGDKDVAFNLKSDALEWWGKRGGGNEPSPDFVREFVAGALDVFKEVRSQVEGEDSQ